MKGGEAPLHKITSPFPGKGKGIKGIGFTHLGEKDYESK